jgi:toxin FitB
VRAILDTSVLIGAESPGDLEGAISAASLAELHFGVLVARDADERARRAQRLGVVEATFNPLPIDAAVAREWGRLAAAVLERGGRPRRRAADLAIAATANVAGVPLMTDNKADFKLIEDLVDVRVPAA